ncbi:MAG: substrate-binding domain-containing protein, partial [Nitrososphaerota archaeon]|nr:substrate-binding domain-containing protein [Nitrososphaerota archaeon]
MPTPKINVAAAASLKNGLGEIIEDFEGTYGVEICVKYAGSYALANEIVAGCPYDIYLAASDEYDIKGMKQVSYAGKILQYPPLSDPSIYPVRFIANDLVLVKNAAWMANPPPQLTTINSFDDVTTAKLNG